MFWSLGYLALRCLLELVVLRRRSEGFKELEIVVLRHELSVLRRQAGRPQLQRHSAARADPRCPPSYVEVPWAADRRRVQKKRARHSCPGVYLCDESISLGVYAAVA